MNPTKIYLEKMNEILVRLKASKSYFELYHTDKSQITLESAILQIRKTMECVALAAIAPNHQAYSEFRQKAKRNPDYRKYYNGTKILKALKAINKDFYPIPLYSPESQDGNHHFIPKTTGFLTEKKFQSFYDRLGKYLHADNPWGQDKGLENLINDFPTKISELEELLKIHFTTIRTDDFNGVWVTEVPFDGGSPRVIRGQADGEFVVKH